MTKVSARRRMVAFLVTFFMVTGIVLPAVAGSGLHCPHHHAAQAGALIVSGHDHHDVAAVSSGRSHCHDCDKGGATCNVCAMSCCGVIVPSIATAGLASSVSAALFVTAPPIADGLAVARDPYPPKPSQA